jgi:hypothetical protein
MKERQTMRPSLIVGLALLVSLSPSGAIAGPFCDVQLSDWQPLDALRAKLDSEGWRDVAIHIEDGCYLVHPTNDQGERLLGKFDPATLEPKQGGHWPSQRIS